MSTAPCSVPETQSESTVGSFLARSHGRSTALCDQMLGTAMDPDATFVERWGALRFVSEQLQERCDREQKLLKELRALLPPQVWARLARQGDEAVRLRQDVELLAGAGGTGHDLAKAMQDLSQAVRLWHAEIEFGLGDVCLSEISPCANQILNRLNYRLALQS